MMPQSASGRSTNGSAHKRSLRTASCVVKVYAVSYGAKTGVSSFQQVAMA